MDTPYTTPLSYPTPLSPPLPLSYPTPLSPPLPLSPPPAPSPQDTGVARVHLSDQFYTRDDIATDCIRQLIDSNAIPDNAAWVEPAAGAGAFLRALEHYLPQSTAVALDIHPRHPSVRKLDFLTWEPLPHRNLIVFGNPPFGRKSAGANAFIRHAACFAKVIAFILPRSFVKHSMHHVFPPSFHLRLSTLLPPNAFTVNDEPHNVPCVFQVWTREATHRAPAVASVPQHFAYTRTPNHDPSATYDLALRRVGAAAGTAHIPSPSPPNPNTHYYIRLSPTFPDTTRPQVARVLHDHLNQRQQEQRQHKQPKNTTGARSLSHAEFTTIINPFLANLVARQRRLSELSPPSRENP